MTMGEEEESRRCAESRASRRGEEAEGGTKGTCFPFSSPVTTVEPLP